MGLYAIRTTTNKEKNVASKLADRAYKNHYNVFSIVVPGLKGYIFVEGEKEDVEKMYKGVAHVRGLVQGETSISEIEHFLAPKPAVTKLEEGYIVEVSSGPFKGERAKIISIDSTKNEVTIELLEATVPIPITIPAESVRVIEKSGEETEESESEPEIKKDKKSTLEMPE